MLFLLLPFGEKVRMRGDILNYPLTPATQKAGKLPYPKRGEGEIYKIQISTASFAHFLNFLAVSPRKGLLQKAIEPQSLVGAIHELPLQNVNDRVVQQTRKPGSITPQKHLFAAGLFF